MSAVITTKDYIATTALYPEWLLSVAEYSTIVLAFWLCLIFCVLWLMFHKFQSTLDTLLSKTFKAEFLRSVITLLMGLFLYSDYADGVKTIVLLRPLVLLYAVVALTRLLEHYLLIFNTTLKIEALLAIKATVHAIKQRYVTFKAKVQLIATKICTLFKRK